VSSATEEIVRVCEALSPEKRDEVVDFARFLLAKAGDDRWEELIASPERRPKLDAFLKESASKGDEPLDVRRL
jgi:hypothetical protein